MSEYSLQIIASMKISWIVGFSAWYGFGGIENKWLRRYLGSVWMLIGIIIFSLWTNTFHFWYLLYPLLLCAALHIGYGGDNVLVKIKKRAVYGVALGVAAIPLCFPNHSWMLFGIHCGICIMASVFFGVFNPTNARNEETIIGTLSTLIPLFLI